MNKMLLAASVFCLVAGCAEQAPEEAASTAAPQVAEPVAAAPIAAPVPADPLVDKVWTLSVSDGRPGVMRVFLSDGVMIQDSCWETYRLSTWRRADDGRIVWNEDGLDIEAVVEDVGEDRLTLRLLLGSDERVETYAPAGSPFVCPDMPR